MNTRTRLALPLVQVVVAAALTMNNLLRPDRLGSPSWTAPDRQFCDGLNAPAALVRFCLIKIADRWLPGHYPIEFVLETIVYLVLVWLVWYIVSIEIGGNGQSILTPKTGKRNETDVLAIIFGGALGLSGLLVRRQFGYVSTYSNLVALPYFFWGATVMLFYGHDIWTSFGKTQKKA